MDLCTALTDLRLQIETFENGYPECHPLLSPPLESGNAFRSTRIHAIFHIHSTVTSCRFDIDA